MIESFWKLEPQARWWTEQAARHGRSAAMSIRLGCDDGAYQLAREAGHYAGLWLNFAELMAASE